MPNEYTRGFRVAVDVQLEPGQSTDLRAFLRAGNRALTAGLSFVARRPITDGQSGYRAFSPAAAAAAEVIHDYNYAQVLTLDLLAKGFRYVEVPISYHFRTSGRSFVTLRDWNSELPFDGSSMQVDPQFVDFDGPDNVLGFVAGVDRGGDDDFHLAVGSPAIDGGDPQSYFLSEPAPQRQPRRRRRLWQQP